MVYNLGFNAKLLMSSSGKTIYMLLKSKEEIIKFWAEKLKSNAEYEMGKSDLSSLEPCDKLLLRYRGMEKAPQLHNKEKMLEDLFRIIDKQTGDDEIALIPPRKLLTDIHWQFYSSIYIYIYI